MFKIATWNVNSLRIRLSQLLEWLAKEKPDMVALQETKLPDPDFPLQPIVDAGYAVIFSGQKSYNGMAILSRQNTCTDIVKDIPGMIDPARRILGVTYQEMRILNLYVPNGESVASEKYHYKLNWLHNMRNFIADELQKYPKLMVLGDFNIAPYDTDVHDPKVWEGRVLFSEEERKALYEIMQLGLVDCFRLHTPNEKIFSWWDYRLNSFKRNLGLRIDHIFVSDSLKSQCSHCYIDRDIRALERPSDHAPVVAEFEYH